MKIVYLRSLPFNQKKIYEQIYDNAQKKANNYIYSKNDRIKKICSCQQNNVEKICQSDEQNSFPYIYDIFLIQPDENKIKQTKLQMLQLQKEQFKQQIESFSSQLIKVEKSINRLLKNKS